MNIDPQALIADFLEVARISGVEVPSSAITFECQQAPHIPPRFLPAGKCAVYVFALPDQCLKVGKAGPRSQARYTSHHYNFSAPSTLAKSLLKLPVRFGLEQATEVEVGEWIKRYTCRVNFLLDASIGVATLNLLEAFIQCRLQPVFEGFPSQQLHTRGVLK